MLTKTINSYLFLEYLDEPIPIGSDVSNLQSFVNSYNELTQEYLDWFNSLNFPIYTTKTNYSLDWVAYGLYGMLRPTLLPTPPSSYNGGAYDTIVYDKYPYNTSNLPRSTGGFLVNDDDFRRILTWNFYKGDGFQYTTTWLKRRVKRFLFGIDGVDFPIDNTYEISVEYSNPRTITITIPSTPESEILQAALNAGAITLPFEYNYEIVY